MPASLVSISTIAAFFSESSESHSKKDIPQSSMTYHYFNLVLTPNTLLTQPKYFFFLIWSILLLIYLIVVCFCYFSKNIVFCLIIPQIIISSDVPFKLSKLWIIKFMRKKYGLIWNLKVTLARTLST